jgi:diacylglycerol kinase (ATP)
MNRPSISGKAAKTTSPVHPHVPHSTLTGRNLGFWSGRLFSFAAAVSGAVHVLRTQPNAWIELAALAVVVAGGWYFQVSAVEWAVLAGCIFGVLSLEAVNTSVEAIIDLVSPHYHPLAKTAKDAAAGALVFAVLGSLCVAVAVFVPRILSLF